MEHLDTCICTSSSKSLEGTHCTYICLFSIFVKTIIFFLVEFQFIVPEYIHDDVIEHQTTWYVKSMIIIKDILLFQWIKNRVNIQWNIFDGGKNSLPNCGNIFLWFFCLDWRQSYSSEKNSLMDVQCELNTKWFLHLY